jgi:hypothetical protein
VKSRIRPVAWVVAFFGGALAVATTATTEGCGTDAVGIDACRQVETARCEATRSCGATDDEVTSCSLYYRDACLHGIENATRPPTDADTKGCVAAVNAVRACADAKVTTIAGCTATPLADGANVCVPGTANANLSPCQVIHDCAHILAACAFAVGPKSDAGVDDGSSGDGSSDAASD